jgi:hypothetical protein
LPSVDRLGRELQSKGLEVVLVDVREDADLVRRAVRERGYTARVLLDRSGDVAGGRYGVFGPPTVYLIDRAGRLLARAAGPRDWDSPAARALIDAVLAAR